MQGLQARKGRITGALAQLQLLLGEVQAAVAAGKKRNGVVRALQRRVPPTLTFSRTFKGIFSKEANAQVVARGVPALDRDSLMLPLWGWVLPLMRAREQQLRAALALVAPQAGRATQEVQGLD